MSALDELMTAALLGTDRAGAPAPEALLPALQGLDGRPAEERVLIMAGSLALQATAGRRPAQADPTDWRVPAFRAEGDRPACSPAAARLLENMLSQAETALLPELLERLDRAGQRVPDALLPQILDHGARVLRLRPQLLPIMGERGRWLSAINPAWRYAAVDFDDPHSVRAAWEADPPGRPALARMARRRDPALTLRLINATWRDEPDAARRDLIAALEAGLSSADEPFLERALDDRFGHVRQKAAALLATIPDSRLVQRMTAGAGDALKLVDGRLVPVFPAVVSDPMVRDGVIRWATQTPGSSARSATEYSRFLIQTVGAIPLAHWETTLGGPEFIVATALKSKWPRTIITALATAALRQKNAAWIDAILTADDYSARSGLLVAALAPVDCYARLAERIAAGDDDTVVVFLRHWPHDWDEDSGALLIDFFDRQSELGSDTRLAPALRYLSRSFALRCPPALADRAAEALGDKAVNHAWKASLTYLVRTLKLRQELRDAVDAG